MDAAKKTANPKKCRHKKVLKRLTNGASEQVSVFNKAFQHVADLHRTYTRRRTREDQIALLHGKVPRNMTY
jgi:ribosomal protein L20